MTTADVGIIAGSLRTEFILRGRKHVRAVVATANLTDTLAAAAIGLRSFDHLVATHFGALTGNTDEIVLATFSAARTIANFNNSGSGVQTMSIYAVGP